MSILKEFKEFAVKGNAVDMAVGIIIGAAFSKVVSSLVDDVIMPPIGFLVGGIDFSDFSLPLSFPGMKTDPVMLNYGAFFNAFIDFTITAGAVFLIVKAINTLRSKKEPTEKECPECKMDIPSKAKKCRYCTSSIQG